jgi:hypothetical protein
MGYFRRLNEFRGVLDSAATIGVGGSTVDAPDSSADQAGLELLVPGEAEYCPWLAAAASRRTSLLAAGYAD